MFHQLCNHTSQIQDGEMVALKKKKKWLLLTLCQPRPSCIIAGLSLHIAEVASAFMRTHHLETPVLPPGQSDFNCASPFFVKQLKSALVDSGPFFFFFCGLALSFVTVLSWRSFCVASHLFAQSLLSAVLFRFFSLSQLNSCFPKNMETFCYEFSIDWYYKTHCCCVVFFYSSWAF